MNASRSASVARNRALRTDPTRTTGLRARFIRDMDRRWTALQRDIVTSIVDRDCFGIQPQMATLERVLAANSPTLVRQFGFERTDQKIASFMAWLESQQVTGPNGFPILEIIRRPGTRVGIESAWTDTYIRSGYQQGIRRARQELRKAGVDVPTRESVGGGIASIFNQPIHADAVAMLFTRTFDDLKTVTQVTNAAVRRQISDGLTLNLAQGIAEGRNPRVIARIMAKDTAHFLDTIGKVRSRTIARTEIIRAHHLATINEYERIVGDIKVEIKAEWTTAGFDVCAICIDMEAGNPYTLAAVRSLIPAHPNCRCVVLPIIDRSSMKDSVGRRRQLEPRTRRLSIAA